MGEPGVVTLLAALAGGAGAVARYLVESATLLRLARSTRVTPFPYGTWFVNLSGALLIGMLLGVVGPLHPAATVLGVGLLGGYTTFSTASYDTVRLLQRGRVWAGLANGFGQLVLAVAAAAAGFGLGTILAF